MCVAGTTTSATPRQHAADGALLGGLVLEVELVERLLADPAQQDAGVEGRERHRERRAQGVEQGEVGADRLVEPGAPQLHRDRRAVERAAVDLGQRA